MRSSSKRAVLAALLVAAPASASAQTPYEIATLGPRHAAEHAAARAATPSEITRRARVADGTADVVGRWSDATVALPTFAINAVLLPTGKVAFWGRPPLLADKRENLSQFWLWDPVTGSLVRRDAPRIDLDGDGVDETPAPLFCSGQSLLADGQLFVAGGNLGNPAYLGGSTPNWRGLDRAYTFDPWTETWREQPRPRHGRWYPSQVELADGRIAILAGYDEVGLGDKNLELEVFTPAAERGGLGTMTYHPAGNRDTAFYPHLFTLRDGRVFLGGPDRADSGLLDPAGLDSLLPGSAWTSFAPTHEYRVGGNAILWPQGAPGDMRVTLLGGYRYQDSNAVADTETFDDGWVRNGAGIPAMRVGRSYGNVVQLPDGTLLAVGGGAGQRDDGTDVNYTGGDERLKQVELLRPGIDTAWTLGPPQRKWRAYHSTALLLPDGRVLSAGDDYWHLGTQARPEGGEPMDVGEVYSPPYLFDGDKLAPRPLIEDGPVAVPYGAPFGIRVRDGARAVLVAPGATTHGADMNQRLVVLETLRTRDGVGLDVRAPRGPGAAPPGYYMLFVFDNAGTPSVARWVRVGAAAPAPEVLPPGEDLPPTPVATPPPGPAATPPPGPAPTPAADRRAPRISLKLTRRGRKLTLRLALSEPGRADVELRLGHRRIRRALRFTGTARTLTVTRQPRAQRLRVLVRARDAAGNRRTLNRRYRT
jgi:hypothetical protein